MQCAIHFSIPICYIEHCVKKVWKPNCNLVTNFRLDAVILYVIVRDSYESNEHLEATFPMKR
jgi:hypothetical protein